jgi:hypothetical protein
MALSEGTLLASDLYHVIDIVLLVNENEHFANAFFII